MAKTPDTAADGTAKVKRTRAPSAPKAVFAVIQVLDESGQPMALAKSRVNVISFERSAEEVLAKIEGGEHPGALYLRGMLPAGR